MLISFLQTIFSPIFGRFEREEFKKFLRMGLIFAFALGSYWTIRVLKDAVFISLVNKAHLPWAKTASLILLIPVLMIYTKILEKLGRERMFYALSMFYGIATIAFGFLILNPYIGQAAPEVIVARTGLAFYLTKVLGYLWYVFVESYGSLVIALFWAIATDITMPESAKKGFYFVTALGQIGGIIGPRYISGLPRQFGFETSAVAMFVSAGVILMLQFLMKYLFKATPKELLISFHGKGEAEAEAEQEPGFTEGLRLLLRHRYLLSIFGVIFFYEVIVTIFDFHFKTLAATHYTGRELDAYLGHYGSLVNTVALLCLLLGIGNITRYLGVGTALILMPLIVAGALFGFISLDSLEFLFVLMVGSKAINYALNGPALKQLYIPTTHDVRFKASAWIETFGSRSSKEAGSIFNMLYSPLVKSLGEAAGRARHVALSSYLGFSLVVVWLYIAIFLGKTYKKAVNEKRVVC
jgi:AAA family ATP:ADP antiporter